LAFGSDLVLVNVLCAYAQIRPDVTPPRKKPAAPKPAQILIQTSPNAQVYLDDIFKGQASPQGRLVVDNPKLGDHPLRVSLAGKRSHEQIGRAFWRHVEEHDSNAGQAKRWPDGPLLA
jgi:hypothetical protein